MGRNWRGFLKVLPGEFNTPKILNIFSVRLKNISASSTRALCSVCATLVYFESGALVWVTKQSCVFIFTIYYYYFVDLIPVTVFFQIQYSISGCNLLILSQDLGRRCNIAVLATVQTYLHCILIWTNHSLLITQCLY